MNQDRLHACFISLVIYQSNPWALMEKAGLAEFRLRGPFKRAIALDCQQHKKSPHHSKPALKSQPFRKRNENVWERANIKGAIIIVNR